MVVLSHRAASGGPFVAGIGSENAAGIFRLNQVPCRGKRISHRSARGNFVRTTLSRKILGDALLHVVAPLPLRQVSAACTAVAVEAFADVSYWPIASFRGDAKVYRYRGMADHAG